MSALLLIGVLPAPAEVLTCAVPHLLVPGAPWSALALEVTLEDPVDEAARLLGWAERQHQVLVQYAAAGDVLPVATGAVFSSEAALAAHVQLQTERFDQAIGSVSGCCEFILHVQAKAPKSAPAPASGGSAFLAHRQSLRDQRHQRGQARARFLQRLRMDLDNCAQAQQARDVQGKDLLADFSVLVPRQAQNRLVSTLRGMAEQSSALGLALRLIGPTPAYSFLETAQDG